MKIYIAAPYAARDVLRPYAEQLAAEGNTITSSWLEATHKIEAGSLEAAPSLSDDYATSHSLKDIEEVRDSDLVIFVTWETACLLHGKPEEMGANSGGRHVETGVAFSHDVPVIIWGQPENIFQRGLGISFQYWWDVMTHVKYHNAIHDKKEATDGH